jgi:hypothetical protein
VHVAFEILKLPPVPHHADHVGVVLELGNAVLHHLGAIGTQHAELARVHRQANPGVTGGVADGRKSANQDVLNLGLPVKRADFRVAVKRQEVTAQAQHAQRRRQSCHVGEQRQLRLQVVCDDLQQPRPSDLYCHAVHPAQGGGTRVERRLDHFQLAQRQAALRVAVLACETDACGGHGFSSSQSRLNGTEPQTNTASQARRV